jgi:hypothetical protein
VFGSEILRHHVDITRILISLYDYKPILTMYCTQSLFVVNPVIRFVFYRYFDGVLREAYTSVL